MRSGLKEPKISHPLFGDVHSQSHEMITEIDESSEETNAEIDELRTNEGLCKDVGNLLFRFCSPGRKRHKDRPMHHEFYLLHLLEISYKTKAKWVFVPYPDSIQFAVHTRNIKFLQPISKQGLLPGKSSRKFLLASNAKNNVCLLIIQIR